MKTTITTIAKTGLCNFCCSMCELQNTCNNYNHKDNSPDLDQKDFRQKRATEYLMREGVKC